MKEVAILQHRLLHYRTGLFQRLRDICAKRGIRLHLVHGQPSPREIAKKDEGTLCWAHRVNNRFCEVGGRDLVWQQLPSLLRDADLIVVMQENRLISNYPLLLLRRFRKPRVAYWGHGRNFQTAKPHGLRERWKQLLVRQVDWWFAYTQMTRDILLKDGYPDDRITVLDNAIDNEGFSSELAAVSADRLAELRMELGAGPTSPVGLFCGSLYPDKRLDFLVAAADKIQAALPDFRLVVIGDGPSADEIRAASATRPWLSWVGVQKGLAKAAYFRLASVVLNPGLVGLHVLDSFCAGVPMITTPDARHSPEIAYLQNGANGLVVAGTAEEYAQAVINLLGNDAQRDSLRSGALAAAQRYTLANMVDQFATGMERCLSMPRKS